MVYNDPVTSMAVKTTKIPGTSPIWKRVAAWGFLVLGLLVIGYLAAEDLTRTAGQSVGIFSSEEIQGDVRVGQTFVAPYPGLNRIDVMMDTFGRINTHEVVFHLRRGREAGEDIFAARFDARHVRDRGWQPFSFPPLGDPAGTTYYFFIESPDSTPGNAIAVMGREGDPYPQGAGYVKDETAPGDMAFKTYYQASAPERLDFLLDRLTADKPSVWGDGYLYIGLALLYGVLLVICLSSVIGLSEAVDAELDEEFVVVEDGVPE